MAFSTRTSESCRSSCVDARVEAPRRDLSSAELLEELASHRDDDGLDHVAGRDGRDIGDPEHLGDDELRELFKLARWRVLLWRQQDE